MLNEQQVAQFHRDGYILGPVVLSDSEVEALRNELTEVAAAGARPWSEQTELPLITNLSGDAERPVLQIINIWEAGDEFRRLIANPIVVEEIAQLTDASELRIWHDQIQYKPAETGGVTAWHQDSPLWPTITPMIQVSAWVALDDVDEGNGCMSMVPGSHKWGNDIDFLFKVPGFDQLPESFEGHKVEKHLCPVKKGQVHYHHGLTWHASHSNLSNRPRRALAMHYMPETVLCGGTPSGHPLDPWVTAEKGEKMTGDHFPLVWTKSGGAQRVAKPTAPRRELAGVA